MTKRQTEQLRGILAGLEGAQRYILQDDMAVARKNSPATTTLHYTRADGSTLYEVNKEIGSELAYLHTAINRLASFVVSDGYQKGVSGKAAPKRLDETRGSA